MKDKAKYVEATEKQRRGASKRVQGPNECRLNKLSLKERRPRG